MRGNPRLVASADTSLSCRNALAGDARTPCGHRPPGQYLRSRRGFPLPRAESGCVSWRSTEKERRLRWKQCIDSACPIPRGPAPVDTPSSACRSGQVFGLSGVRIDATYWAPLPGLRCSPVRWRRPFPLTAAGQFRIWRWPHRIPFQARREAGTTDACKYYCIQSSVKRRRGFNGRRAMKSKIVSVALIMVISLSAPFACAQGPSVPAAEKVTFESDGLTLVG